MSRAGQMLKDVSHRAQALAIISLINILKMLGPVRASNFGGWAARGLGPHLAISKIAEANLRRALPSLCASQRAVIIRAVWDNLGRNAAEIPYLSRLKCTSVGPGWELHGAEHIENLQANGGQALFFSGHLGNWEMVLPIAGQLGFPVCGVYRPASNRYVDKLLQKLREKALCPEAKMFPKGVLGARAALAHLEQGGSLGLLVDQKMNDGIGVPFFGEIAMTAPALAQFALRFQLPIMPVHVERLGPARFRMICEAPLNVTPCGDKREDIYAIALAMNAKLEDWIRASPDSWLWLHRRWPKAV